MSYSAERWARAQTAGNARAKAVLIELAHCHNEKTGLCNPSAAHIAKVTELKADTVYTAIRALIERGLIRKASADGAPNKYELVGFKPEDWTARKDDEPTPKTGYPPTPNSGYLPTPETGHPRNRGTPENGVPPYPENGVPPYPEFGVLTGNKNREIEQGISLARFARESAEAFEADPLLNCGIEPDPLPEPPASLFEAEGIPVPCPADAAPGPAPVPATGAEAEKPQPASKPKAKRGTRLSVESLPDEWRAYCEAEDAELDPERVFEDFRDYWSSVSGAKGVKLDWAATWRQNVRSYRNAPDWKRGPKLKRRAASKDDYLPNSRMKRQSARDYTIDWDDL